MQVIKKIIGLYAITGILLQSCIYNYNLELSKYDDLLVVYGMITTEKGPHEIQLSRSTTINGSKNAPVKEAIVKIIDDKGNIVSLVEGKEGFYYTPDDFAGVVGVKYKLNIILKNDNCYESDFVELIDVPEISEIHAEYTIKEATQLTEKTEGYQFYVDVNASNQQQQYYKWEMIETWEITMPYEINYYNNGDTLVPVSFPSRCWRSSKVKDVFIANTNEFQTNSIQNFPLSFTNIDSERLRVKYRLMVKQLALTEASYFFWKGVLENSKQEGSLFDKQPYQVIGNIRNVDNPKEIVLGLFSASAVKSKYLFVEPLNIYIPSGFESCSMIPLSSIDPDKMPKRYYAYFGVDANYIVLNVRCVDCTVSGSTSIKPDNWE